MRYLAIASATRTLLLLLHANPMWCSEFGSQMHLDDDMPNKTDTKFTGFPEDAHALTTPLFDLHGGGKPLPPSLAGLFTPFGNALKFLGKIAFGSLGLGAILMLPMWVNTPATSGQPSPYGYNVGQAGQGSNPFNHHKAESNQCYQVLEGWLRECSSDPGADGGASFLDLSIDAGPFTDVSLLNASWLETSSSSESIQHPDMKRVSREEFIAYQLRHRAVGPSEGGSAGKPSAPMTDSAKRKMGRYLNQVNYPEGGQEVANVYATLFKAIDKAGKTSNKDSTGGGLKSMMGMMTPTYGLMGWGAPMMGGLPKGPDMFQSAVPISADPFPFQNEGPEKCYRYMDTFLSKCGALSLM